MFSPPEGHCSNLYHDRSAAIDDCVIGLDGTKKKLRYVLKQVIGFCDVAGCFVSPITEETFCTQATENSVRCPLLFQ